MTFPMPAEPERKPCVGWMVHSHGTVDSTQALARALPAWSAVVATSQMHGRGQYERTFLSDVGGFYLTAVLPFDGDAARWRGFALAVGWAVQAALCTAGGVETRLRWPNDLMIGPRKVGGILVEQGGRDTLLVGLGLNVSNQPWRHDATLRTVAARLADQPGVRLSRPEQWQTPILSALAAAHAEFSRLGLAGMSALLNPCWREPRAVELTMIEGHEPAVVTGVFVGINQVGNLFLTAADGTKFVVPENQVRRLREL